MMNAENLFKQAIALIRENDSIQNSENAWNIARALQILIEANKLESEITPLKIKIIMAMASCNYQIGNFDYAYNCAVIAKEKIDEYIKSDSPFDEISTRKLLREEDCDEIIEAVKRNGERHSRLMESFVLNTLCTINIRKVFPPKDECMFTRDELYYLIHALERAKNAIATHLDTHGDYQMAERIQSLFNLYKYPLYYIWQKYQFGKDEDVWVEGENVMPYQIFISNIKRLTDELILMLNKDNPFTSLSNGSEITKLLHTILSDLQMRLHKGRI